MRFEDRVRCAERSKDVTSYSKHTRWRLVNDTILLVRMRYLLPSLARQSTRLSMTPSLMSRVRSYSSTSALSTEKGSSST
ncbi:MAG: hypothetical protein BWY79_01429 [Actinobacteria bacterium ADurb.Bin444]|nr:MAG: hypothetical protein BWY79_01429 [Actinobacteria bacterium ADurb.Bin444]